MQIRHTIRSLPFVHPFTISKGTKTHQPVFVVALNHLGFIGYGEAPAISYYHISAEKMAEDLESRRKVLEKFAFTEPERYWHFLHHLFPANPFLVCALDMAGWDIYGKMKRCQLRQLWKSDSVPVPLTDYTIGIDATDKMIAKMKEKPWPIYKIKVGFEGDVEVVEALRKHTDAVFRVDANAGWTLEQACHKIPLLHRLGVELVEQPLAKDDFEGMRKLHAVTPVPLFADESCVAETDVDKCAGAFHGINIKLTKCSGITPALRMIRNARNLGLKVMLGCMNESSIGTAALAQLAPMADFVDMDGPLLLQEDLAEGVRFDAGRILYREKGFGLGVEVRDIF
jgi:L-alanine-DL-glutamate epimerase-like enolase superfamily enzyme